MSKSNYTTHDKLNYYAKRVKDNRLTQGQRDYASKKYDALSGVSKPVSSAGSSAATVNTKKPGTLEIKVHLRKTKNNKPFATASIIK